MWLFIKKTSKKRLISEEGQSFGAWLECVLVGKQGKGKIRVRYRGRPGSFELTLDFTKTHKIFRSAVIFLGTLFWFGLFLRYLKQKFNKKRKKVFKFCPELISVKH